MPRRTTVIEPATLIWLDVAETPSTNSRWRRLHAFGATLGLVLVLAGCGGGGDGGGTASGGSASGSGTGATPLPPSASNTPAPTPDPTPTPPTAIPFSVGGVLEGLAANQSLVLVATDANGNNPQTATLNANGSYTATQVPSGSGFVVSVQTQPVGQTCSVTNGSGTVSANISNVRVDCSANRYTVGGSISNNLGVVSLRNSVNDEIFTTNGQGAFSFAQTLLHASSYNVVIDATSAGQSCNVMNASGTATANVSNLQVTCQSTIFSLGGALAGLAASRSVGILLTNTNSGSSQASTLSANGSFTAGQLTTGTNYAATVQTQPVGQTCVVTNATGTVGSANINTVSLNCGDNYYTLGGSVSNNLGTVSLRNTVNGNVFSTSGQGAFSFTQTLLHGSSYNVVVDATSAGQSCNVMNASGTATANVSNLQVDCVAVLPPPPATPTGLAVAYSAKQYAFSWTPTASATYYELAEDPDGVSAQPEAAIGGSIITASYNHALTTLLHQRLNAQYRLRACNTGGCSAYSAAITPDLTQAIGYFKASNTEASDNFGWSVALSADGNTLAVAGYQEDSNATGVGGNQADNSAAGSGAVYVFIRSSGTWSQQAYLKASNTGAGDLFGFSMALSSDGNTLAVGARWERSNATGVGGNEADNSATNSGAAYVFIRSSGTFSQQAYIKASNTGGSDSFGEKVALSSDGNTLAVVAIQEDSNATGVGGNQADNSAAASGAVYVFTRSGSTWSQQAYIKASNTEAGDQFGYSVALSGDGNTLAVGANREDSNATAVGGNQADNSATDSGAVYVFTRSGVTWSQQAYIKASNPGATDEFGFSVALSADGSTLAVGAPYEDSSALGVGGTQGDNSASNAGAVYVFTRSSGTWSQQTYLKASNTGGSDFFGWRVALSADGNTLAVAAYGEDSNATGVGGNQADNSASVSGAVYVLTRSSGLWSQQAYIKASNTGSNDQSGFAGFALSADGSTLAVGAYQEGSNATGIGGNQADNSAVNAGAVYVY